tara:strand:+ start:59 stop:202 length:144 start_codon:yes stop_codon:yes gene_type:complete
MFDWIILFVALVTAARFGQYLALTNMKLWQLCLMILAIKFMVFTYAN